MHTPLPVLYVRGVSRQRAVKLMQGPRATTHVSVFDLLKDGRAALGLDLVRRLLNQRVAVKPRDPGIDRVVHVLDGSLGALRVFRVEARGDHFFFERLEPFGSIRKRLGHRFGKLGQGILLMSRRKLS
jgi:hypothetical protein